MSIVNKTYNDKGLYPLGTKNSENSFCLEKVCEDEIKPKRNITHLNLS